MPRISIPALLAIPLLPAAFAAGWFGVATATPEPAPPQPPEPVFMDIGNIHVRMGNHGLPVAYRTGVTLDPNLIDAPSLAWMRDRTMRLIARAAEMPMVQTLPDPGPRALSEALASFAPDWMLHVKMLPADDPELMDIDPSQWPDGADPEAGRNGPGDHSEPSPAEQLQG